jgi:glutamate racemase
MNNNPIGVFDSGLGGLSVWHELRRALPGESLLYLGDGKNCPYGRKAKDEIIGYAEQAAEWLVGHGAKMMVVACNTATTAAIEHLRATYDMPIVGMEPAVKPAALTTRSGKIAIIATRASLDGEMYHRTAARYGEGVTILTAEGKGWVELVENNMENSAQARIAVEQVVRPLVDAGADKIVLGCTHYPFLEHLIEEVIEGSGAEIVDSGEAVARRVKQLLAEYNIAANPSHEPVYEFHTFADDDYLYKIKRKASLEFYRKKQ